MVWTITFKDNDSYAVLAIVDLEGAPVPPVGSRVYLPQGALAYVVADVRYDYQGSTVFVMLNRGRA